MPSQTKGETLISNGYQWRIIRDYRLAPAILVLATVVTLIVFLPHTRFVEAETGSLTIVRANGETYRTEIKYAMEIARTNGLHDLWSRALIAGYIALFLSPCAIFVYATLTSLRQLRFLQNTKAEQSGQDVVWNQFAKATHTLRLWLSILLGLLPSLILAGIYLSGVLFEVHRIRSLTVYDFELRRMLTSLGVLVVGWWGMNLLAIPLATLLTLALKEPLVIGSLGLITMFPFLIVMYMSTILVFSAASPLPISGASEFSMQEIAVVPLTLYLVSPFFLTGLLLFFSRFLAPSLPGTNTDNILEA